MKPLLEIHNLATSYGKRRVLEGVNLTCQSGEFIGLIGPNGAGKTTLLRSILGLTPVRAGEVKILDKAPHHARGLVGYVPQKHNFQWDFPITIKDAVMTGRTRQIGWLRRPSTDDWLAVLTALRRTNLEELQDRPIAELSGGQRQRVLLARALATGPRLLLLDEPFTGVDTPTQHLLNDLYLTLANGGITILMSTHDILGAHETCQRIIGIRTNIALDTATKDCTAHDLHDWLLERGTLMSHESGSTV